MKEALKGSTILLAEDNPTNREIAKFYLETAGAKVLTAENGEEAILLYTNQWEKITAVLMDIPVMDGLTATRRIRELEMENAKRVPIFAMTGDDLKEVMVAAKEAGMDYYLVKPLSIEKLVYRISRQPGKNKNTEG